MRFVNLWNGRLVCHEEVSSFLCSKNLLILSKSSQQKTTWDKMEIFLTRLLKHQLIFPMLFEGQCVELLREEWDKVSLIQRC